MEERGSDIQPLGLQWSDVIGSSANKGIFFVVKPVTVEHNRLKGKITSSFSFFTYTSLYHHAMNGKSIYFTCFLYCFLVKFIVIVTN